jgi:hypothetical protein
MKMRSIVAVVGLAISFALPTFAQQKETVDPQIIEQLDALTKKFMEFINNNDATAVAAVFTEDAVFVTPQGPVYGREAIEKYFTDVFQRFTPSENVTKIQLCLCLWRRFMRNRRVDCNCSRLPASWGLSSKCVYPPCRYLEDSCGSA